MPNFENKLNLQQNTVCSVTNFTQNPENFTPSRIVEMVTFSKSAPGKPQENPWKTLGKPLVNPEKTPEKPWEKPGKARKSPQKPRANPGNTPGKPRENPRKTNERPGTDHVI